VFACIVTASAVGCFVSPYPGFALFAAGVQIATSIKMGNVWRKFVILGLGQLQSTRGAGLFTIIPILHRVIAVIDGRIRTTAFSAGQTLTKDTVPVNVDAIICWHVHDSDRAALTITDYR
jgi:regulator of protease activity HflC (stomatin/prohibitin superfamily)